jgi:hypothetical protein
MRPLSVLALLSVISAAVAPAAQPPELAMAMQNLRDQRSYSWEVINGDPGPVAQSQTTRRGTVTSIQQSTSPHVKGRVTSSGEMLLECDWPDGLRMTTFVSTEGVTVTQTPEGWMTNQEVLDAIADERARTNQVTDRLVWLRRADRPDIRRPDQDLEPFIKGGNVSEIAGDSYVARLRVRPDGWVIAANDDSQPAFDVTFTLNIRLGVLRSYEVKIEGARNYARAGIQLPVNDDRIVVLTYVPVTRLDVPDEAREKLKLRRPVAGPRN